MRALSTLAIAIVMGVLSACSSTAPSARQSPAAPSPSPEVAVLPRPVCAAPPQISTSDGDGNEVAVEVTLTCEKAVQAAVAVLPAGHLPILGIEFQYGNYCPSGWECPVSQDYAQRGYVVFLTASRGIQPGIWVQVRADDTGNVQLIGGPDPFPPAAGLDS